MVENVGAAPLFEVPNFVCYCYTTFSIWQSCCDLNTGMTESKSVALTSWLQLYIMRHYRSLLSTNWFASRRRTKTVGHSINKSLGNRTSGWSRTTHSPDLNRLYSKDNRCLNGFPIVLFGGGGATRTLAPITRPKRLAISPLHLLGYASISILQQPPLISSDLFLRWSFVFRTPTICAVISVVGFKAVSAHPDGIRIQKPFLH